LKIDLGLKKEHIAYFLRQFANMDYTDLECQKKLIKVFVNSVFVYDDKVVLTFNYSEDNRTITLNEIDAGLQQGVRMPDSLWGQNRQVSRETCRFYFFTINSSLFTLLYRYLSIR